MFETFKQVVHDGVTCLDGKTYDPLKVIGYPSMVLAIMTYLGGAIYTLVHTGTIDLVAFGTGFTAMMSGLLALAAGVAVKSHTEPGVDAESTPKGDAPV